MIVFTPVHSNAQVSMAIDGISYGTNICINIKLVVQAYVGYTLQTSSDLSDSNKWQNIAVFEGDENTNKFWQFVTTNSAQFFRLIKNTSLTVATDAASPAYQLAPASSVEVTNGVYRFHASNEEVFLYRLGLQLSSGHPQSVFQVSVWDESTQIGSGVFLGNSTNILMPLSVFIPKDTDKELIVKVDLAAINTGSPAIPGDVIKIDINPSATAAYGFNSGLDVLPTGSTTVAGIQILKSVPTVALETLSSVPVSDGRLINFSITSAPTGDTEYGTFSFTLDSTRITVSNLLLFCFTDSSYTTPLANGTNGIVGGVSFTNNIGVCHLSSNGQPLTVPAGKTYYFQLQATSITVFGSSYSVTTTLHGDLVSHQLDSLRGAATKGASFIWSPNDRGQSLVTDLDWVNGYRVRGLPSSGLIKVRTN